MDSIDDSDDDDDDDDDDGGGGGGDVKIFNKRLDSMDSDRTPKSSVGYR